MSDTHLGASSAKRATWRDTDTRPLLRQIFDANPNASDHELFRLLWLEVRDDPDHLQSIVQYWFDLAMVAIRRPPQRRATSPSIAPADYQQKIAEAKTGIRRRIVSEAKIILLELLMPNGKRLGNCTGHECKQFGGWFAAIAKKVPARKIVVDVLSQQELFEIWKQHK